MTVLGRRFDRPRRVFDRSLRAATLGWELRMHTSCGLLRPAPFEDCSPCFGGAWSPRRPADSARDGSGAARVRGAICVWPARAARGCPQAAGPRGRLLAWQDQSVPVTAELVMPSCLQNRRVGFARQACNAAAPAAARLTGPPRTPQFHCWEQLCLLQLWALDRWRGVGLASKTQR